MMSCSLPMLISKEMSGAIEAFQYQIVVCSECKLLDAVAA